MENRSKRIAKNTLYLYLRTFITMLIALYTSRVILQALGNIDFGIYNLVASIVVLFSFLNTSMTASTQRFINVSIGRGENNAVSKVFTFALISHFIISIIIIVLGETVGLWFVMNKLNIPADKMNAAFWVYQISLISTLFSVIRCPFNASIIAYEKFSFFAWMTIVEAFFRLGIALMIMHLSVSKLIFYATAQCIATLIVTIIFWLYCDNKLEYIKFKYIKDRELLKKMLSFSGWSVLGNAANVSTNQGVAIVLNVFYGIVINAAIGIANQLNAVALAFVSNFQTAFMPQISQSYAAGDTDYFNKLIFRTSKYSFFLIFIVSYPVFFNCNYILDLWLGKFPEYTVPLTQIIILCSIFEALCSPLWMAAHAKGNIRNYQLIISLIFILNIFLCFSLAKVGLSASIAFSSKLVILIIIYFYRLWYLRKYFSFDISGFFKDVLGRIFTIILFGLLFAALLKYCPFLDIVKLVITILIDIVLLLAILLDKNERYYIQNLILKKNVQNA